MKLHQYTIAFFNLNAVYLVNMVIEFPSMMPRALRSKNIYLPVYLPHHLRHVTRNTNHEIVDAIGFHDRTTVGLLHRYRERRSEIDLLLFFSLFLPFENHPHPNKPGARVALLRRKFVSRSLESSQN